VSCGCQQTSKRIEWFSHIHTPDRFADLYPNFVHSTCCKVDLSSLKPFFSRPLGPANDVNCGKRKWWGTAVWVFLSTNLGGSPLLTSPPAAFDTVVFGDKLLVTFQLGRGKSKRFINLARFCTCIHDSASAARSPIHPFFYFPIQWIEIQHEGRPAKKSTFFSIPSIRTWRHSG